MDIISVKSRYCSIIGRNGARMTKFKYDWNEPPQPQMVGFRDLVGVGIAPVSKTTAVKSNSYLLAKLQNQLTKNGHNSS